MLSFLKTMAFRTSPFTNDSRTYYETDLQIEMSIVEVR